jgi:hypothetical protein
VQDASKNVFTKEQNVMYEQPNEDQDMMTF